MFGQSVLQIFKELQTCQTVKVENYVDLSLNFQYIAVMRAMSRLRFH